jgi:hypothetical protein
VVQTFCDGDGLHALTLRYSLLQRSDSDCQVHIQIAQRTQASQVTSPATECKVAEANLLSL